MKRRQGDGDVHIFREVFKEADVWAEKRAKGEEGGVARGRRSCVKGFYGDVWRPGVVPVLW